MQSHFSKVYYNHTKICLETGQLRAGKTKLRYGIVQYDEALQDISNWTTLVPAYYLQKPHIVHYFGP